VREDERAQDAGVDAGPALRRIFASPSARPSIGSGSIRESMHVSTASPFAARPCRPASPNPDRVFLVRREDVLERVFANGGTLPGQLLP
jgi:hypothetical protein